MEDEKMMATKSPYHFSLSHCRLLAEDDDGSLRADEV